MRRLVKLSALVISTAALAIAACVADEPNEPTNNDSDGSTSSDGSSTNDGSSGGDGSGCTSAQTACGGSCVELDTDKKNCGSCGHDCLGGDCNDSKCVPTAVFTGTADAATGGVQTIAVDPKGIYWATPIVPTPGAPAHNSNIYSCPLTGDCVAPMIVEPSVPEVDQMRVTPGQPNSLFFTEAEFDFFFQIGTRQDGGQLGDPCGSGGNPCQHSGPAAYALALDDTTVFYGSNPNGNGSVYRVTLADAGSINIGSSSAPMQQIAIDADEATHAYVYAATTNVIQAFAFGNAVASLTNSISQAEQIVVGHSLVFWTSPVDGKIYTVPTCPVGSVCATDQTPTTFASYPISRAITADATNIYWSGGTGDILSCPLTGCTGGVPTKLASGTATVRAITTDATTIYWGDDSGSIYRVAK
ncbi:MAG: hypothetical protein ACRELY_01820 [Polyangiaceae bacterium]